MSSPETSRPTGTLGLVLAAVVLFVLRHDVWLRDSATLVANLPVSLLYHLAYCFLVSAVLAVFVFRKPSA